MAVALPSLQGYTLEDEPLVPCLCITYQPTMSSEQFRQAQTLLLELITKRKVQKRFIDTFQMALISPGDRVYGRLDETNGLISRQHRLLSPENQPPLR